MRRARLITVIIASLVPLLSIDAQTASILNVPGTAEEIAMGGLTAVDDALTVLDDSMVSADVSYFNWSPQGVGSDIINAEASFSLRKLSFFAKAGFNSFGSYGIYDEYGNPAGDYSPNEHFFGVGAAYAVLPKLAVSLTAKYIGSDLAPEAKGSAFAADVNVVFRHKGFEAGLLAANLGTELNYGETSVALPMVFTAGARKEFGFGKKLKLDAGLDAGLVAQGKLTAVTGSAGLKLEMLDMISLMGGYRYSSDTAVSPSWMSAGIGLDISVVSLSAAYLMGGKDSPMSGTLCLTLGLRL